MKNFKKFLREQRVAFTLAEVVIVMAILSIMMVAFAPVVTKRTSTAGDAFRTFQRTEGNHGIYYATRGDSKPVVLGDNKLLYASAFNPRLVIAATTSGSGSSAEVTPHMAFLTENSKNIIKYTTGQLLVTGGYNTTDATSAPANPNDEEKTANRFNPYHWLMPSAFAVADNQGDNDLQINPGSGTSGGAGDYLNPVNHNRGITVVLGGNPDTNYKMDVGDKNMTIIGGNACGGATGGVAGLTCLGANTGKGALYGLGGVYIGLGAGAYTTGSNPVYPTNAIFIGEDAGAGSSSSSLAIVGQNAIAIGKSAGAGATVGQNAIAIGKSAGAGATVGQNAIAIGADTTANQGNNIAIGNTATASGDNTIAMGKGAKATGYKSIAIGQDAEAGNDTNASQAGKSVAIGYLAKIKGSETVAIGNNAGNVLNTSDGYNVFIGSNAGFQKTACKHCIYIGDSSYGSMSAEMVYFGGRTLKALISEAMGTSSDERLKNVGKPFTVGIELINKIEPVNFTYKRDENKFPHVGVIAQDLMKIFPNAVSTNKDGFYYIRTEDMFYAAINAIKELYQLFLNHDRKITELEQRNAVLEQQNKELQDLYLELAKRVERLDKKKTKNVNFTQMPEFEAPVEKAAEDTAESVGEEASTETEE